MAQNSSDGNLPHLVGLLYLTLSGLFVVVWCGFGCHISSDGVRQGVSGTVSKHF
jgi:hypothetical protein